jgi:hypothetical protein
LSNDRDEPGRFGPLEIAEFGLHMRHRFGITLTAIALTAAALPLPCAAQLRLFFDHPGLGLRQETGPLPRGWGSSLEVGYTPESVFVPRQHSFAGELRTALGDYKALSVGVKYRVYDMEPGTPGEAPLTNGLALMPSRPAGASYAPGYQVRLGYQHSSASLFGLGWGRDMETVAAALDPTTPYPRQLSFTGLHWLTPTWAVSYDLLSGDLEGPSPLRLQGLGLRFGVRYRF